MSEKKKVVYPEPENLNFVLRYFKTKVDKYIRDNGNRDFLRIFAKDIARLMVGDINDYEIAIKNNANGSRDIKCSRCKHLVTKTGITSLSKDNNSFCPNCGLIRLLYNRNDIYNYITNNRDLINELKYIEIDELIIYKDLYNRAVMSVQWKLRKRLEKYIAGDLDAIEKSEMMEENNII